MTITRETLLAIIDAARDAMLDDFPTTRHAGAARLKALLDGHDLSLTPMASIDFAERALEKAP